MPSEMRLLVGYDGFERRDTLPRELAFIARNFGAEISLHHAVPLLPKVARGARGISTEELQDLLVEARRRELVRVARSVRGIQTSVGVTVGSPADELIREAVSQGAGLVAVLANSRRFADKGGGFGTTTTRLMQQCPAPVWALRPRQRTGPLRVMAAVDVNAADPGVQALSARILEVALAFASHSGSRLCILHVWSLWGEGLLRGFGGVRPNEVARLEEAEALEHRRELSLLLARHDLRGVGSRIELVKGDPVRSIPEAMRRLKIDILIVGTHSRTGLPRLVSPNTAERILNRVSASVVAVKPPGFVSPRLP